MAYPVSAAFTAALASAQMFMAVTATVTSQGIPVAGFQGIPVESAVVTVSRANAQRTTVALTIDALSPGLAGIVPTDLSSPLAPNGNEVVLSSGLRYASGAVEVVPLGVFPITTVTVTDTGADLTVAVQCADRAWSISRRALLAPYTIPAGLTLDQALYGLLTANTSGLPPFAYAIAPTTAAAPMNTYNEGQDPWQAGLDLASGAGAELFFDRQGNLTSRPIPQPNTLPQSWASSEATQGGPLAITRVLTANQIANDFIISTANSAVNPPLRAEAADTVPTSRTFTGGQFGDIPMFMSSSTILDLVGVEAAANAQLLASLGNIDTLTVTTVPNPAVDVDDIYSVTRARAGLTGAQWVVDGYTLNIGVGSTMAVNLRRVTL